MDPLSITLAVITLATALKDIIETAEIIQDSFSKLPQNYRNAKRLAEEVLETLHGMEEIYLEHEQTFNKAKSLKKAIKKLQVEMKAAHEQCIRLIPPVSERKRDRFKTACYSFWRRGKVERLLSELKDHIDRCSQQFQLLSSFQSDALIIEIHDTIVQSTSRYSAVVHSHSSLGGPSMPHSGLGHRTNSQLYAFTQTTPTPMTWMTDTIPVRDLSKAYLRREVGRVNLALKSILVQWSQNPPEDVKLLPRLITTWDLEQSLASHTVIHQEAVVVAFRIQSILQSSDRNWELNAVISMLHTLTICLINLDMEEDYIGIRTLIVTFRRIISRRYPSPTSSYNLADALTDLANALSNTVNQREAYSMREEAIDILWSLAAHEPTGDSNKQDIELLAENRIRQAEKELSDRSLRLALDGHNLLEDAFKLGLSELRSGMCFAPNVPLPVSGAIASSPLDIELRKREIPDEDWCTYSTRLLTIARIHRRFKLFESSFKLAKLSLTILNHLLAKHPGSRILYIQLDYTLDLLNRVAKVTNSQFAPENLEYLQQHVTILRRLAPFDPGRFIERLAHALWLQSRILLSLGRSAEAKSTYEDIIGLKDLAAAPVHSDLQIPSETEADYYAQLAGFHYHAKRFSDTIYAAQNASSQYTALEFMDPDRSRAKHIGVLSLLCRSFSAMHQYDRAVSEAFKVIKMLSTSDIDDAESDFVEVLKVVINAPKASSHPEALAQAADLNTHIRKFVRCRELKFRKKLAPTLIQYADLLQTKGRVEEAVIFLREMLNDWREMFADLGNTTATELHIKCLLDLSQTYDMYGDVEKALRYKDEARLLIVGRMW